MDKSKKNLSQELLQYLLKYDPATGIFIWINPRSNKAKKGAIAGSKQKRGYVSFIFKEGRFYAHQLAFLYMKGFVPKCIDHIDGDCSNNSWENLREVTHSENLRNAGISKRNKSGIVGVSWCKTENKWRAYIAHSKKFISLGSFSEFKKAVEARHKAEVNFGFHENHGKRNSIAKSEKK